MTVTAAVEERGLLAITFGPERGDRTLTFISL